MKLPKQSLPIFRTATGIIQNYEQPIMTVDFLHASQNTKIEILTRVLHGGNYNMPARFIPPEDFRGCHILSGNSMAMCLAALRRL
jgi:cyanobactin biosynthesis protein (PatB/AcyB/McaB family)